MKIGIANDHRGYSLKQEIYDYIHALGYSCVDYGTDSNISVDYVDYAVKLCKGIINGEVDIGILICGTGIGMSIAANKIKGIRCARVVNVDEARLAKEHNMANVLAIGEDIEDVESVISAFINTDYSKDERHIRRVDKIKKIENQE
jgi:ribose 5-phosphate isomerase B